MESTSCKDLSAELLRHCLEGSEWGVDLLRRMVREGGSESLFRIVIERLGDLFEPRLCDTYARLMSQLMALVRPELNAGELLARYQRIRAPRPCMLEPRRVFVLSRVTLGADIAITSVLLNAALSRFPQAEICFVGSRKSWELFAGHQRLTHLPVAYVRAGSAAERIASSFDLARLLDQPDSIVIDPDSRLTQLGIAAICQEDRYFFFESRARGGDSDRDLPTLAAQWARDVFGIEPGDPWLAVEPVTGFVEAPFATVSLGVGENPEKRVADPFEPELLGCLGRRIERIVIDEGAGGEEAARVERAIECSGVSRDRFRIWKGSFAGFASLISQSSLYAGYDSAGQHAAAALGVSLLTVFAGQASPRMMARWRPTGRGAIELIDASQIFPSDAARCVERAVALLLAPG